MSAPAERRRRQAGHRVLLPLAFGGILFALPITAAAWRSVATIAISLLLGH